ncbi:hypothetical protein BX661DRAFT_183764 [Kickxella alabastrina]|uniref:uncharacterized protein n=1 Tax=Kickxella alabastrina TaxID=61397 RepID=UPI00221FFD27|nr:uncharacterized protein BX661DRAFT_183764 [Kickxella alabastrina]KAI7826304.1 hypothetical protein BX661DRAFT_183764 [Kickxella alabastrina]
MRAPEKNTTQQQQPLSPSLAKASALQLPPPSYDDVALDIQAEHINNQPSPSSFPQYTALPDTLTHDTAQPLPSSAAAANEVEPLIGYQHIHPANTSPGHHPAQVTSLSLRDFFASLEYKRSSKGYSSSDQWLNTDPAALLRFISECNERPRVNIEVKGTHTENKVVENFSTGENGQTRRESHTQQESIVDFQFSLELTSYIHERGTLYTARGSDGEPVDLQGVLADYIRTDNFLKEIKVQKKAIWDYELVRREMVAFVKSTGYPHTVTVSFPMDNDRIVVRSHGRAAQIWRHPVTNFLCVITCACLVGWPMRYFSVRKWRNKVMSDFAVLVSPKDFIDRNSTFIRNQVSWTNRPFSVFATMGE